MKTHHGEHGNHGGGETTEFTDYTDSEETWVLVQGFRNFLREQNVVLPEPLNKSV
jgi:hypothetical protein